MTRISPVAFLTLWLLVPVAHAAQDEEKPILAVMEIESRSDRFTAQDVASATDYLRAVLVSTNRYYVVDKGRQEEKRQALVGKLKRESHDPCYDEKCKVELGKELAADTLLNCAISSLGSTCAFSCELVPLDKGASENGGLSRFDCTGDGLATAIEMVVKGMAGIAPPPAEPQPARDAGGAGSDARPDRDGPPRTQAEAYLWAGFDPDGIDDFVNSGMSLEGWRRYQKDRISYWNLAWCGWLPGSCPMYLTFRGGTAWTFIRGVVYMGAYFTGYSKIIAGASSSEDGTSSGDIGSTLVLVYFGLFGNIIDGAVTTGSLNDEWLERHKKAYPWREASRPIPPAPYGFVR